MWDCSKDAERIMCIPAIHLPAFAGRVQELAADPSMTFDKAVEILDAELQAAGVTQLDFEMCQPGNSYRVPFAVSASPTPEGEFKDSVTRHIHNILGQTK